MSTDRTVIDYVAAVIRDDVRSIKAYPVSSAAGMVKLDAMENPYRLPEALREEIGRAIAHTDINRYPDPTAPALKAALREAFEIPAAADILIGNGSDEIIDIVTKAVARPGAVVLGLEPSFVMYKINAGFDGVRYEGVSLRPDFSLDIEAVLARIVAVKPALVWIAYPNNPTGNLYADADIERILRAAPGLVVVDEAYNVFARRSFMARLAEFPNLLVMRTVSKIGLAGIRLGYAAAHPAWMHEFDKVRPPYNVSVLTQAVAETVLRHRHVFDRQADEILATRTELIARLKDLRGVESFPTEANFVLARVRDAVKTHEALKARKILVRSLHGWHPLLQNCLRLTVGTPAENELLAAALEDSL